MATMVETLTEAQGRTALTEKSFKRFSEFITRELGIKMPPEKTTMLESRLQKRMHRLGLKSLKDYESFLFNAPPDDPEWNEFINIVTTNKTDFFREPEHFDYLSSRVLPSLAGRFCSVCCAGCSTGEEAYTLAMVLAEFSKTSPGFDFSIFASDISTRVLHHAEDAIYDAARIEPVSAELRHNYLLRSRDPDRHLVRIAPELRLRLRFARINFMDANYGITTAFDVVFFRNVMIYFSRETQARVLGRICHHMKPRAHLFVGHSESLTGLELPLEQVGPAIYRKIP